MKKIVSIVCAFALIAGVVAQKLDRSKRPTAGPAREIKLGKIESFTLPNGLKVFVVENHKLPKVAYSLTLDVDPILEGDMAGYVSATGQLLERGTKNRTKDQLDEEIDFIGATLNASGNGFYAASLKKHEDKLLQIMSDVVMNADFKQDELDKIKKQTISGLVSEKDDPDAIVRNVRSVLLYGKDHPYGEIITEETAEKITLEKCKSYYQTYFKPNVSYMAVVGDITLEEAKKNVEKYFGTWKKGEVPVFKYRTPQAPSETSVAFVHKEGATQSLINITYPLNLKRNNPDVIKSRIMNSILGGGSTARLFMNLREGHGYTYGAYSGIRPDELVGNFNANAKVRNEVTDSSVYEFMVELNKIVDEKVTEEELQDVKNNMMGTFSIALQNPQTIARFAINIERYHLSADYYETYLKQIEAVTVDDVKAMANKYIKPNNTLVLVVGDKSVGEGLGQFAASKKVNYYDIYGNDYVEPLKAVPAGVTAKMVIDNSIKAVYGTSKGKSLDKKLKKIKDLTVKMDMAVQGQTLNMTRYQKFPNKFATEMAMGSTVVQKQTFNGKKGKVSGMQGDKEVTGTELEELKLNSIMFSDTKYDEMGYQLELLGMEPIEGKDAYKLLITKPDGKKQNEWYDVISGLQVRIMSTRENKETGDSWNMTTTFSDYREVDGIKHAHKIKQIAGPQTMDIEVTSIEINTKLGDELFE